MREALLRGGLGCHFIHPERVNVQCSRKNATHSRRAGQWLREGIQVCNTGSFMPLSREFAVSIEGEHVRYCPRAALLSTPTVVQMNAS